MTNDFIIVDGTPALFCDVKVFYREHVHPRFELLTYRQVDVLRCIAHGLPRKVIAHRLDWSKRTIELEIAGLQQKLGISNPAGLVLFAASAGLVHLELSPEVEAVLAKGGAA